MHSKSIYYTSRIKFIAQLDIKLNVCNFNFRVTDFKIKDILILYLTLRISTLIFKIAMNSTLENL